MIVCVKSRFNFYTRIYGTETIDKLAMWRRENYHLFTSGHQGERKWCCPKRWGATKEEVMEVIVPVVQKKSLTQKILHFMLIVFFGMFLLTDSEFLFSGCWFQDLSFRGTWILLEFSLPIHNAWLHLRSDLTYIKPIKLLKSNGKWDRWAWKSNVLPIVINAKFKIFK